MIATGIASFGHVSGVHYQNKADMKEYQSDLTEHGKLPLGRGYKPTRHQLLVREMILLLKRGYLDVDYFQNKFEVDITQQWSSQFQQHSEDGMLTIEGGRIQLTRKGFLNADALLQFSLKKNIREFATHDRFFGRRCQQEIYDGGI